MRPQPYTYRARPVRVIDGDTLVADLDLGFDTTLRTTLRLAGCNARELSEPGGREARAHLEELLLSPWLGPRDWPLVASTIKPDKFGGRYDAHLHWPDTPRSMQDEREDEYIDSLVDLLIRNHWAAPWDGRGPRPLPPWPRPEDLP